MQTTIVKSSGAEAPAAINVAPATSSENESLFAITFRAGINLYMEPKANIYVQKKLIETFLS